MQTNMSCNLKQGCVSPCSMRTSKRAARLSLIDELRNIQTKYLFLGD